MSFIPVYLSEIPGAADPGLLAALDAIARAPEAFPLEEAAWESALVLIEQHTRAEQKSRSLQITGENIRRGWIQLDTTTFNNAGARTFSFHTKPPVTGAGTLVFPVILERAETPWKAPALMLDAVLNRPEVRPLFSSEPLPTGPVAAVLRFLSRGNPQNPGDEDSAEFIREVIDGRAIDCEHYLAQAVLAALTLGHSIGRAETLDETQAEIRQGIKMEGRGKRAKGVSEFIDQAIAAHRSQGMAATLQNVRDFLRITKVKADTVELHSTDPTIEEALQLEGITKNPDLLKSRLKQRLKRSAGA